MFMLNAPILHCLNFEQVTHFNLGVALFLMQNDGTSFEILTFCAIRYTLIFISVRVAADFVCINTMN